MSTSLKTKIQSPVSQTTTLRQRLGFSDGGWNKKTLLLGLLTYLAATNFVAAQPVGKPQPALEAPVGARLAAQETSKVAEKGTADAARRIKRSMVDRRRSAASIAVSSILDKRLSYAASALPQALDAFRLKQLRARRRDPQFLGVIDSVTVGGTEVTLERRRVRTDLGVKTLLLNRVAHEYVYDGDIIVPRSAIQGLGMSPISAVQGVGMSWISAGVAGTFGKGKLWDDAIIPFEVEPAFCCEVALASAIAFYESNTIFRFVPRDGHETYVRFVNALPFTNSRTTIGKQDGENIINIQGTGRNGEPFGLASVNTTIQHEIGHVLGLIHEHLRADRDRHIARHPTCVPATANIFDAIVEGWVDLTQSTFTDDSAELLTAYDFNSVMHYSYPRGDSDGDGIADCSTWVRIATCPERDATSPMCSGEFSGVALTERDIEGLHKLYISVPNDPQVRTFTGDNVRHRGRRIDRCLHGGLDGCSVTARGRVADEFCQSKGFEDGSNVLTEMEWGEHSGYDLVVGWKNVWGADVISSIACQDLTGDAEGIRANELTADTFAGGEVNVAGRRVDRCVHGDGIMGDRCSTANQRLVADRFCELKNFTRSSTFSTDFSVEVNSTGFHPSTNDFRNVSSLDIFTEISCVAAETETSGVPADFQTFAGDVVRHRDRRIDRCLHNARFGEDGCSAAARARVATEFCRTRGFQDASQVQYQGMVGEHSGFDRIVGWKNVWGADAISSVRCANRTRDAVEVEADVLESRPFNGDEIKLSGRLVDRCVHGDQITGDRCSRGNQRRIANEFCERQQFERSSGFQTELRIEANSIGYFPSNDSFRNVSSADVFTQIICVRPPGNR